MDRAIEHPTIGRRFRMQQASSPIPSRSAPVVARDEKKRPRTGGRQHKYQAKETIAAYLFLAPYIIVLAVFTLAAVIYGFYLSLFKIDLGFSEPIFIGFRNYITLWNKLLQPSGVGEFRI